MYVATWAHLMKFGKEGYRGLTEEIAAATKKLVKGINSVEGLKVVGSPQIGNVGCISIDKTLNIYELGNYLHEAGWGMAGIPKYPGLHLTIIPNNIAKLDLLIKLIRKGAVAVREQPGHYQKGPCKLLQEIEHIPSSLSRKVLEECYHECYNWKNYDKVTQAAKKKEKEQRKRHKRK